MAIHPVVRALIKKIDDFRSVSGMSATAFGKDALNDSKFVSDLHRRGRTPSLETIDRVERFMRRHEKGTSA